MPDEKKPAGSQPTPPDGGAGKPDPNDHSQSPKPTPTPDPSDADDEGDDVDTTETGDDGDDDDADDEEGAPPSKIDRQVHSVSLAKHNKKVGTLKQRIEDLQTQLQEAKRTGGGSVPTDELKAIAEEAGIPLSAAEKLVRAAHKITAAEFEAKYGKTIAEAVKGTTEVRHAAEDERDKSEFKDDVLPEITAEHGEGMEPKALKQMRKRLLELAHTRKYHMVPLQEIYRARTEFRPKTGRKSAESSRQGAPYKDAAGAFDPSKVKQSDIPKLSPEEFELFAKYQKQQEKR
ncbi:MAG: hypothetical protein PHI63_06710 [Patescibacteria group bacterium]|nr:hypothetical protein [Patescibacteria group bacterium]